MRSHIIEQVLNKQGVKFEYVEKVSHDQINHQRGMAIQARLQPLDLPLIDSYREMRCEGFEPPPLLLWKPSERSMYVTLDGNQRVHACKTAPKKHQTPFSAYVVDTDDQMVVDRLCWQFNNLINGRRLSYEESLAHALTFCRKYDQSSSKVAKDWGVKDWELKSKLREAETRELIGSKNVDLSHVPTSTVLELAPLDVFGEDLLVKAAKVVAETGVGSIEVRQLNADVKKARTHDAKIKVIEDFAQTEKVQRVKAETKGGRVKKSRKGLPREQIQRKLSDLKWLLDEFSDVALRPIKEDRDEYSEMALWVSNRLISIYGLGSFLNGQEVE